MRSSIKSCIVLLIVFSFIQISLVPIFSATYEVTENNTSILVENDLFQYQEVIDRINEKYDMSIESCEEYVQRTESADLLLSMTPEEFEKSLLDDIATISAVRAETAAYLAGLPSDLVWQEAPMTESSSVDVTFEDILSVGKR